MIIWEQESNVLTEPVDGLVMMIPIVLVILEIILRVSEGFVHVKFQRVDREGLIQLIPLDLSVVGRMLHAQI